MVLESKLKAVVFPSGATFSDQDAGQAPNVPEGTVYCPDACVTLQLQRAIPTESSDTISNALVTGQLQRAYNTKVRYTRANLGAANSGATVEMVYKPDALYRFRDLSDNLDLFSYPTNGVPTSDDECANKSYFVLTLGPTRAGCPSTDGTSVVHGRVLPHRVSIEMTHKVLFYMEDPGAINGVDNVPLSAEQSFAGQAAGVMSDIGQGAFDAADTFVRATTAGVSAAAMTGHLLKRRRRHGYGD